MRPNRDAKAAAEVVHVIPASQLGCAKGRPELFPAPAREAVDAMVRFAIGSPLRNLLALARSGPKKRQVELTFEGSGPGEELLVIPGGRVNPKGLRMNLVDRNVDVLVVRIAITRGDLLVLGKT